jgi:hypothetical protein
MTQYLDYNAGKKLSHKEKSWNALKDIYTWRVYFKDGGIEDFYDHLGTKQEALDIVANNVGQDRIVEAVLWEKGMPEHPISDLDID